MASHPKKGIRDWTAKRSFLRAVYNEVHDKSLVAEIVTPYVHGDEKLEVVERCYDTFRRWSTSRPSSKESLNFWKWIIQNHALNVLAPTLWSCSLEDFIAYFPPAEAQVRLAVGQVLEDHRVELDEAVRVRLQKKYKAESAPNLEDESGGPFEYTVDYNDALTFEGPQTGIKTGRIQHVQFYTVPEAAVAWAELVDSKNYRMYLDCVLSLKELVGSQFWLDSIEDGRHGVAVILGGGGSPEKDWILAESLRRSVETLELVLTDISSYMLGESAKVLRRRIARNQLTKKIDLKFKICDFLKLDEQFIRKEDWRSIVWTLLGGTMGNVPRERDFFRSLNGPSRVGDLLVVGIDTLEGESDPELAARMSTQYRSRELDALLLTPVIAKDGQGNQSSEPVVNVTVSGRGSRNLHSLVSGSRTAVFSTPIGPDKREVTLATSTRYVAEEFTKYAARFGWKHVGTAKASADSTFHQLLLKRIR